MTFPVQQRRRSDLVCESTVKYHGDQERADTVQEEEVMEQLDDTWNHLGHNRILGIHLSEGECHRCGSCVLGQRAVHPNAILH